MVPRTATLATALILLAVPMASSHWSFPPIEADRAYLGDPLYGLDTPGATLFARLPDDPSFMASATKSWTLHLAVDAIDEGIVALTDVVTISANAARLPASGNSLMTDNTGTRWNSGNPLQAGEQVDFDDLLEGMMRWSGNDAATAVAEHVAAGYDPTCLADDQPADLAGAACDRAFAAMMTQHADALGLQDTIFMNAYGIADVNAQFHHTTARDMATWMTHARDNPLFQRFAGGPCSAIPAFTTTTANGGTKTYGPTPTYCFDHAGRSVLFKPGSSSGGPLNRCNGPNAVPDEERPGCLGATLKHAGRWLATGYMQGKNQAEVGDGDHLFETGFDQLFHPDQRGSPNGWQAVTVHDASCATWNRAVSAAYLQDGRLKILTWDVNVDQSKLHLLGHTTLDTTPWPPSVGDVLGFVPAPVPVPDALKSLAQAADNGADVADPGFGSPLALLQDTLAPVQAALGPVVRLLGDAPQPPAAGGLPDFDVDVQAPDLNREIQVSYLGDGYFALATRTALGIHVASFGVYTDGTAFLADGATHLGSGTDLNLETLRQHGRGDDDALALLTFLDDEGRTNLRSLTFAPGGELVGQGFANSVNPLQGLDMAAQPLFIGHNVVTVGPRDGTERLNLESWTVSPQGGIEKEDQMEMTSRATAAHIAAVNLDDEDPLDLHYVVPLHLTSGDYWPQTYSVDRFTGTLVAKMTAGEPNLPQVDENTQTSVAALHTDGLVTLGRHPGGDVQMFSWDLAPAENDRRAAWRLSDHAWSTTETDNAAVELCQVPWDPSDGRHSEGDYLASYRDGDDLRLRLIRVGDRPGTPAPVPDHGDPYPTIG
ncbi:MAG: hypothetical protein ACPGQL_04155 [Thermoplasmatota archaeon]